MMVWKGSLFLLIQEVTMIATIGKAYDYKGGAAIKTTRPPADNLSDQVTIL